MINRARINNGIPIFNPSIPEITPINGRRIELNEKRINVLVPTIIQERIFGGISTALKFYEQVADYFGCKRRIIIVDSPVTVRDLLFFKNYKIVSSDEDSIIDYQIVSFNDRNNKTIPVGKDDIFITTAWWTEYTIKNIIKWQAKAYNQDIKKSIYLIQDFEPGFYPWSSKYALAESTYLSELPKIAVFNTKTLMDYFNMNGYKFDQEFYFDPVLNETLRNGLKIPITQKKKQILIYGRPSVPRNAFEIIVEALKIWVSYQSDIREWSVYSVGEKHQDYQLGRGCVLKSLGKLPIEKYANIMRDSYVGISLMISPHPSYPPLEMSTFGIKLITNAYANKNLKDFNENINSVEIITASEIANKILEICLNYSPTNFSLSKNNNYINNKNVFDFLDTLKTNYI